MQKSAQNKWFKIVNFIVLMKNEHAGKKNIFDVKQTYSQKFVLAQITLLTLICILLHL